MKVWSAGHDIDELPKGRRDPLDYNDPLENLLRAVRTLPAPGLNAFARKRQLGVRCM